MAEQNSFKFTCPHCGQHLEVEPGMIGMTVDCPGCGQPFEVLHNGEVTHKESVPDTKAESGESSDSRNEIVVVCPQLPVITVVKRRECAVDRCKNRLKAVGIGIALLCLFVSVGIIAQIASDGGNTAETEGQSGSPEDHKGSSLLSASVNKQVLSSVECLLNFLQLPNDRRLQVLVDSLQAGPNDFKDAVSEYLVSVVKKPEDMISADEKEEAMKAKAGAALLLGLLGAASNGDSQRGVNAGLELGDMAYAELLEKARRRLRDEIERKRNRLIEVAQKYGIKANDFEEALVSHER